MKARALLSVVAMLAAAACGKAGSTAEIVEHRIATRASDPVLPGATARERFEPPQPPETTSDASDDLLDYDLPEGWQVIAPTKDRPINLRPAGDPEASCYLSFLSGSAMGMDANVNRWRGQFGADALSAGEVAALPRAPLFGRDATLVEVAGTFTGMSGSAPRPGFKLLGLIITETAGSMFLKFTGPAALVDAEHAHFLEFAASLRLADGHGHDGTSETAQPDAAVSGDLAWAVPRGWTRQPDRPMREVTFTIGAGGECYIARLGAGAGGLRMNLDRWRSQFGLAPLTDAELAALPAVTVLGTPTPLLELSGSYSGMTDKPVPGQALLGIALFREQDSLFVKFTGPAEVVDAERASFLAFLASLQERS